MGISETTGGPIVKGPMTAKLSAEELERLEALAKAPSLAQWFRSDDLTGPHDTLSQEDADYIAAIDPTTLLKLTAQVREAEAVNATDIELARLRRIASWQPIETWDGAEGECDSVLVSVEGCVGEAVYRGREDGWWWINNYPTDAHGERIFPTHWQPLPPPPARLEKGTDSMSDKTTSPELVASMADIMDDGAKHPDDIGPDNFTMAARMLRDLSAALTAAAERETKLREENGRLKVRVVELESDADSYQRQSLIDYDQREVAVRRAEAAEAEVERLKGELAQWK